jgi:hypothetical protein
VPGRITGFFFTSWSIRNTVVEIALLLFPVSVKKDCEPAIVAYVKATELCGNTLAHAWSASASDMLWALLRMQIAKDADEERTRNDIFAAGTTRDTNMLGFDEAPSFNVAVGAVFYADGSYDKPDEAAFKQMLADRQNRLLTMKKTNEIIQSALATTHDHPVAVAITELARRWLIIIRRPSMTIRK